MKKVELLVTLRGDTELWHVGHIFDHATMPREIAAEIAMDRGTVRIFEEVERKPAVPSPPPPESQPSFSEVAKSLLKEEPVEEEEEPAAPSYRAKHKGSGRWVVEEVDTGKVMSDGYLNKRDAKALEKKLNEGKIGVVEEKPTLVLREDSD